MRHWMYVQRSRIWGLARHLRRLPRGTLRPNADQITPLLWVGGFIDAHDWAALYTQGVRVVVNLQAERQDRFDGPMPDAYLWLPTMDYAAPDLAALHHGVALVRSALQSAQPVLIHCHAGMGRSALLGTAVLVAEGCSVDAAWAMLRSRRPVVNLHPPQWALLHAFAATCAPAALVQSVEKEQT